MLNRCLNQKVPEYRHYGARGITVCDRWLKFTNFLYDMGERPKEMTLDRIDNNGNYELTNCRWADKKVQRKNSRQKVRWMTLNGETKCLQDWCKELGLRENKVRYRLSHAWPDNKALSTQRFNRMGRVVGT